MQATDLPDPLAAALDASFGDGPPLPPVDGVLSSGHRARRRRTTARVAIGGLAAAGLAASVMAVVGPSPDSNAGTDVAGERDTARVDDQPPEPPDLRFTDRGGLRPGPGTEVLRQVDDPLVKPPGERSYAVEVAEGEQVSWVLAEWSPQGVLLSPTPAGADGRSWEQWLDDTVRATGGWDHTSGSAPPLVGLTPEGDLRAGPGVSVSIERLDVDLGSRFAAPGDPTAAAEVEVDGNRWYVLARTTDGAPAEVIVVDPRDAAPTFDGFVEWAAGKYGDGPTAGLR